MGGTRRIRTKCHYVINVSTLPAFMGRHVFGIRSEAVCHWPPGQHVATGSCFLPSGLVLELSFRAAGTPQPQLLDTLKVAELP